MDFAVLRAGMCSDVDDVVWPDLVLTSGDEIVACVPSEITKRCGTLREAVDTERAKGGDGSRKVMKIPIPSDVPEHVSGESIQKMVAFTMRPMKDFGDMDWANAEDIYRVAAYLDISIVQTFIRELASRHLGHGSVGFESVSCDFVRALFADQRADEKGLWNADTICERFPPDMAASALSGMLEAFPEKKDGFFFVDYLEMNARYKLTLLSKTEITGLLFTLRSRDRSSKPRNDLHMGIHFDRLTRLTLLQGSFGALRIFSHATIQNLRNFEGDIQSEAGAIDNIMALLMFMPNLESFKAHLCYMPWRDIAAFERAKDVVGDTYSSSEYRLTSLATFEFAGDREGSYMVFSDLRMLIKLVPDKCVMTMPQWEYMTSEDIACLVDIAQDVGVDLNVVDLLPDDYASESE